MENLRIEDCAAEQIPTSSLTETETVPQMDLTKTIPEIGEPLDYPVIQHAKSLIR